MICPSGIAIVKFQDERSGVVHNSSANLSIHDLSIVAVANFSDLTENTLYQPSTSVYNDGMMLQESSHVDTTRMNASKCMLLFILSLFSFSTTFTIHRHI